ncbi:gamma-glutamyl-gamma-aminobutyrate hydrolase family protein [Burkholderia humptydooensis]|uniref:Gamma-glutamyl-gamma-aminobutyrate hydrolase family protein n=1 Tax=Burkholderia humptydooensis TaxID=430531 RepID=A0A7U4P529_9BURK|nr:MULTISPECIES: gamma-glutamyl-gamma-aminobutyrate hydrolase family protein [Burkholderia]AJY42092.1 putative gamma-glutamyl-gamma-aminobutyrate hydrolase [Burkholderia sp. 2002721687]ALX43139.1 hypothetical protein AQ610_12500 [Burkholderia humptydooensis]QPS44946.1 gamma-glutamyl-gamma-aminobutyrate hydrolase family protein [Burkholderia humptydooensis]
MRSLRGRGIAQLGMGLCVEVRAPDGRIEVVSVADTQSLALGVQGYLEWQYVDNPLSRAIICSIRRGMPRSA